MDEDFQLDSLDRELDAALCGITAPPGLASNILCRIERPRVLPEVLEGLAALSLLSVVLALLLNFGPPVPAPLMMIATSTVALVIAFVFAVRTLNEA